MAFPGSNFNYARARSQELRDVFGNIDSALSAYRSLLQRTADVTAGASTYTMANLLKGVILRDPTGSSRSDVTPTAALIVAGLPVKAVGNCFMFIIQNISDSTENITLTAGVGVTLDPTTIVLQPNQTGIFLVVATNVGAGTETVTIYWLNREATGYMAPVAMEDAYTTSYAVSVGGLATGITLSTELKTDMLAHAANATRHTTGVQSATALTAVPLATTLASLITLTTALMVHYVLHNADMVKASAWAYHNEQGKACALASEVAPTTMATCLARLNDLKAKFNDHEDETTGHAAVGSVTANQIAAADMAYGGAILVPEANVAVGDYVSWSILNGGTGTVTGVSAVAAAGGITFTFSATPQEDAIISYAVARAV
jgi:hypothetical protein